MTNTVWTKNAKEGFVETLTSSTTSPSSNGNVSSESVKIVSSLVADYGNDNYVGKDVNELLLKRDTKIALETTAPTATSTATPTSTTAPTLSGNITLAKVLYVDGVKKSKKSIENIPKYIASLFLGLFYDDIESPEAKKDLAILKSQVSYWYVIPISYLFVINWWYLFCYTTYNPDFKKWIMSSISWSMSPPFYALDLLTYYTMNFRNDPNAKFPVSKEYSLKMWDYRSITFSLFHFITAGCMIFLPIIEIIESILLNGGNLFLLMMVISIYYFVTLYTTEWFPSMASLGAVLILLFLTLPALIFMLIFTALTTAIFLIHHSIVSNFFIIIYNYFWLPSIISTCEEIFDDLKGVPFQKKTSLLGNIQNLLFKRAHSAYLFLIIVGILSINMHSAASFSNTSLIVCAIILNLILGLCIAPSAFTFIGYFISTLMGGIVESEPVVPQEDVVSPSLKTDLSSQNILTSNETNYMDEHPYNTFLPSQYEIGEHPYFNDASDSSKFPLLSEMRSQIENNNSSIISDNNPNSNIQPQPDYMKNLQKPRKS
jgi:hypothetical protein